jgi:hypothetical protein
MGTSDHLSDDSGWQGQNARHGLLPYRHASMTCMVQNCPPRSNEFQAVEEKP